MKKIGILGGTFDPVHLGHTHIAQQALQKLILDEIRFIPVNIPPHREHTVATAEQRRTMLELAVKEQNHMVVDTRELENARTSYTIITLRSLRSEYPEASLVLLMGDDAFSKIDRWKDWRRLPDYAHIATIRRDSDPEQHTPHAVSNWMKQYLSDDPARLQDSHHGYLYRFAIDPVAISSTQIRRKIKQGRPVDALLSPAVMNYVHAHHLYQS